MANAGPLPTRLVALSDLGRCKIGEKVRFLGCVTNYNTKLGIITLHHDYPRGNGCKALVDVKLLLETLKSSDTRVGEWVNVMGYITQRESKPTASGGQIIHAAAVQAIVFWSAGSVLIDEYESALAGIQAESNLA